jgi:hypothetical protein
VPSRVFEAATQVREQVVPGVADKVAEALSTAADRVGAHGTRGTKTGRSRRKPLAIGAGAVAGALVLVWIVRARRPGGAWEYDASRFPSERPDGQEITGPAEAELNETLDNAREAVSGAVDAAADKSMDTKNKVTDLSDRARSASGS